MNLKPFAPRCLARLSQDSRNRRLQLVTTKTGSGSCHRIILADPGHADRDEAWTQLPERRMHWAPACSQSAQLWRPEWTCLRCNATVTPKHALLQNVPPPPQCLHHGPGTLILDMQRGERGWACTTSPNLHPRTPTALPPPAATDGAEAGQTYASWPPQHNPGPTNSWLYVPLLHAGAGRLQTAAEGAPQCPGNSSNTHLWCCNKSPSIMGGNFPPSKLNSHGSWPLPHGRCPRQPISTFRGP